MNDQIKFLVSILREINLLENRLRTTDSTAVKPVTPRALELIDQLRNELARWGIEASEEE